MQGWLELPMALAGIALAARYAMPGVMIYGLAQLCQRNLGCLLTS